MEYLIRLVLLFFAYSFAGWCIEVILKFIQYHRFINRGFFTGPICPIYGSGAVLITITVEILTPYESAYGTTFLISFLLCGLIEYFTSWFMEKRFHARWWDYSTKPMNLHGRVWIGNLILFGIGGVAIIHLINPFLYSIISKIPITAKGILSIVLLGIFAVDYVMTHFILKLVRIGVEKSETDNTEEINREIDRFVDIKMDISKTIAMVRNENYRLILEKRYLCFMTWEQISLDMNYTNRWLRKMHERALDVVDRILTERSANV